MAEASRLRTMGQAAGWDWLHVLHVAALWQVTVMNGSSESPHINVSIPASVANRLGDLAELARPDYVRSVKALLKGEWQRTQTLQLENINEVTGFDVASGLTAVVDGVVGALSQRAFRRAGAPDDWVERVGIYALGSYGRGELAPFSDIDLVVLDVGSGRQPEWVQAGNAELQTLMWDCGFKVGASMRHLAELDSILQNDFVTATAVLEQRPVLSSDAVDGPFSNLRERFRNKRSKAYLRYKLEELQQRRGDAERSLFKLEPNLKLDPGGMRDVQLLRNICFILFGSRNLHMMRELDVVEWKDVQSLFAANDHYLGTRSLLHFHHGKSHDVMHLTDQLWLADLLGYTRSGRLMAVEHMMRLHYQKTLHVHQMVELIKNRLQVLGFTGRRRLLIKTRRKLGQHFSSIDGRTYLADRDFWGSDDVCFKLFDMCAVSQERGLRVSLELQREMVQHSYLFQSPEVRADQRIARTLLTIMSRVGKVRPILEDMHHSGILGSYLPEWGRLNCHMQFNSYHQYTVDHHTLIAIGYLDEVFDQRRSGLRGMANILRNNDRNDLLVFSLLVHDMGKFMGSGHVPRGALMVNEIAERMGLDEVEQDLVHFLVEQHVALSDATRSRDIHDPSFLSELAVDMGDQFRLDLLYCLTYADASAVGDGVFTSWQQAILEELHEALTTEIRLMTGSSATSRPQRVRDELRALNIDDQQIEAHLSNLSDGYIYQVRPEEVNHHFRLLEQARAHGFAGELDERGRATTVVVATVDRGGLLADLSAAINGNGLSIAEARTWATDDDYSLHCIGVSAASGGQVAAEVWDRLRKDLADAAAGTMNPEALIKRHKQRVMVDAPADSGFDQIEVSIDQQSSDDATVVDVRVKDAPGVLYAICRVIYECGCSVEYASIATYGDVARDAFYVQKDDVKLTTADAKQLRSALEERLHETLDATSSAAGHSPSVISF